MFIIKAIGLVFGIPKQPGICFYNHKSHSYEFVKLETGIL